MALSLTQRRKRAQSKRRASVRMLRKGAMRFIGGLGRIKKYRATPRTKPRWVDVPLHVVLARLAARRRQRQNKQAGVRAVRAALRAERGQ